MDTIRGPIELLVLAFPGSRFDGHLAEAVSDLADGDAVCIVDLAFVRKDEAGAVQWAEVHELDDELRNEVIDVVRESAGLLTDAQLEGAAGRLAPGDSAAVLIIEHLWARDLVASIAGSGGQVVAHERIPATAWRTVE